MKILIDDGMQIQIGTGIGNYTTYLYKELKKRERIKVEIDSGKRNNKSKKFCRLKYLLHINSKKYRKRCEDYDIIHYTNYAIPFCRSKKVKYVVTIHDLASFLYPESLSLVYKLYNRFVIKHAIKNADAILTVSESVKNEIITKWPKSSSKVNVAYPGYYYRKEQISDEQYVFSKEELNQLSTNKFFLFVGTIEIRKNLDIVIRAFSEIKEKNGVKLVLVGRAGFGFEKYVELINSLGVSDDVIITGYLGDDDIVNLYRNALAYVFPSIYEGFGSTQLECMKNHTPLILSDIVTNHEVSEGYGLFFKLDDVDSLVKQLRFMLDNKYDYEMHKERADYILEKFEWEDLVELYIATYESVLD